MCIVEANVLALIYNVHRAHIQCVCVGLCVCATMLTRDEPQQCDASVTLCLRCGFAWTSTNEGNQCGLNVVRASWCVCGCVWCLHYSAFAVTSMNLKFMVFVRCRQEREFFFAMVTQYWFWFRPLEPYYTGTHIPTVCKCVRMTIRMPRSNKSIKTLLKSLVDQLELIISVPPNGIEMQSAQCTIVHIY